MHRGGEGVHVGYLVSGGCQRTVMGRRQERDDFRLRHLPAALAHDELLERASWSAGDEINHESLCHRENGTVVCGECR